MPGFNVGQLFQDCNSVGLSGEPSFISNTTETARLNRFILLLSPDTGINQEVYIACENIDRPIARIQQERVWNGADYTNVPMRVEYDPISVKFYEIMKDYGSISSLNRTTQSILNWWLDSSFNTQHSRAGFASKRRATIIIKQLDGVGNSIWEYKLLRCWPEIIHPDPLDYKSSDISKIRVTIHFDKLLQSNTF